MLGQLHQPHPCLAVPKTTVWGDHDRIRARTSGQVLPATSRPLLLWSLTSVLIIPQFCLESPKSDLFQDDLVRFKSLSSSAPVVDMFELQVVLRVPKLQEGSTLVYRLPESPGSYAAVTDPSDVIPLESWMISFSEYGDRGYQGYGASGAYKQGISIFRVAYTLLRWLPAWKFRNGIRRRTSFGVSGVLGIELRVRTYQAEHADAGCGGNPHSQSVCINVLT